MKNATEKYLRVVKRLMPRWNGADVGHTAGRDWYVVLVLVTVLEVTLITVGVYRYLSITKDVTEEVTTLPVRGMPLSEEQISETRALFEARALEFAQFSERAPKAPNPSKKAEPEIVPEEVSVSEETPPEE